MNQTISLEAGGVFLGIPHEAAQNASVELEGVWGFAFGLAGENVTLIPAQKVLVQLPLLCGLQLTVTCSSVQN